MASSRSSNSSVDSFQKREYAFKILVIGDPATGKTCIVKRTIQNCFSEHYKATIGVDFALKILKTSDGHLVRVQLWDIAGQERFGNMTRVYYRDALGCLIVYDLSRLTTFDAVTRWKNDLDSKVELPNGKRIPCILLANKCDLIKDDISSHTKRLDNYCQENNFDKWFETSAKDNTNIEKSIHYLVSLMIQNTDDPFARLRESNNDEPTINLVRRNEINERHSTTIGNNNGSGGCCSGGKK